MQADNRIEKSLLYLSAGAAGLFLLFTAAFLWVQVLLSDNQAQNRDVISPIATSVSSLKGALGTLFTREANIAAAPSLAAVDSLADRSAAEAEVLAAQKRLQEVMAKLPKAERDQATTAVAALEQALNDFLANDAKYLASNQELHRYDEHLAKNIAAVETALKDFLQTAQAISGKIRFAYGSSVRGIKSMVAKEGFSPRAQTLINENILKSSSLRNGIVSEILALAGELNRLSAKIGLVRSQDELNSLLANELIQVQNRLDVNLDDLRDQVEGEAELLALTAELKDSLAKLSKRILDTENSESLVSSKKSLMTREKDVAALGQELGQNSSLINQNVAILVQTADRVSAGFAGRLEDAATKTRLFLLIITVVGIAAAAFGGATVRRNVRGLRETNSKLVGLKDELTHINANLEGIVNERTRTIRTILDHVQFGFLLCDADLMVATGYTRSCERLLEQTGLAGRKLTDLMNLTPKQGSEFALQLSQLFDDFLPESVVFSQVPSRFKIGDRIMRLQGSAVRDENGTIRQILFCLVDISDLEAAERENRSNRILLRILKSPEQFRKFVSDTVHGLNEAKRAIAASQEAVVRRELHTVKGNLGVYELHDIAHQVHAIEETRAITTPAVQSIEEALKAFLGNNFSVLGISYEATPSEYFRVNASTLDKLEAGARQASDLGQVRSLMNSLIYEIRLKTAKDLMGPLDELCSTLANRFGKSVHFKTEGENIKMAPQAGAIFNILPHLVRNALDHGIELPWERGDKNEQATIKLSFGESPTAWMISMSDDGRGIDTDRVRDKAVKLGLINAKDKLSEAELCQLIFSPALSTAETVTDVSGRGVGMSAVAEAVKDLGGHTSIHSRRGQGTVITMTVPKPQTTALPSAA